MAHLGASAYFKIKFESHSNNFKTLRKITIINAGIWGWFPENVNTSNWFGFVLFSDFHVSKIILYVPFLWRILCNIKRIGSNDKYW